MGVGRAPCCDKSKVKRGPWSSAEDLRLITFIQKNGHENWRALPKQAGLLRCGKSCRLRWINYLRPDVKRGNFTTEEEDTIIKLHSTLGNKWSKIASCLPGRTDNEIKNVWNTHLKKRLLGFNKEAKNDDPSEESSASASNNNSLGKRKAESEPQWDHGHVPEKSGESCHDASEESNPSIKDMSRSCSFSSDNSSAVTTNSNLIDQAHDVAIRSEDDHQMDYFFEFEETYDFGMNMLEEVNKPEFVPEVPLDFDFWNMLVQSNPVQFQSLDDGSNTNNKEVDARKWFRYFENELGLEATEDHNQEESGPSIPAETYEILLNPEVDPGMPSSAPPPPHGPFL